MILALLALLSCLPPPPACYTAERACVRQCALHGDDGRHVHAGPHEVRCRCSMVGGLEWEP